MIYSKSVLCIYSDLHSMEYALWFVQARREEERLAGAFDANAIPAEVGESIDSPCGDATIWVFEVRDVLHRIGRQAYPLAQLARFSGAC
jgi:hypothetical protein